VPLGPWVRILKSFFCQREKGEREKWQLQIRKKEKKQTRNLKESGEYPGRRKRETVLGKKKNGCQPDKKGT